MKIELALLATAICYLSALFAILGAALVLVALVVGGSSEAEIALKFWWAAGSFFSAAIVLGILGNIMHIRDLLDRKP